MSKGTQEFFEVFRRDTADDKLRRSGSTKKAVSGATSLKGARVQKKASAAGRPVKAAKMELWPRQREAIPPKGAVTWSLSHEMLVVIGVSVLVALAFSHAWGYRRGRLNTAGPEVASLGSGPAERAIAQVKRTPLRAVQLRVKDDSRGTGKVVLPAEDIRSLAHVYTLRLISGITKPSALAVVKDLQSKGYHWDKAYRGAFFAPSKDGRAYTVYVGLFPRRDAAEAIKLQQTFARMAYQGRTQYAGCYIIRVKNPLKK